MRVTDGVISGLRARSDMFPSLSVMSVSSDPPTSSPDFALQISACSTSGHKYSSYPKLTHTFLQVSKICLRTANSSGNRSFVPFGGCSHRDIFTAKNKSICLIRSCKKHSLVTWFSRIHTNTLLFRTGKRNTSRYCFTFFFDVCFGFCSSVSMC